MKIRHPEKVNKPISPIKKKPSWIRSKLINSQEFFLTKSIVNQHKLKTVCQEANCPNIAECWSKRHATFLIRLGNTTIITDPVFSKNMGPLIFGPKRYVNPAIDLKEIPEINLYLLTHNHYDHLDYRTIKKFPHKKTKVLTPLKLSKYFTRNGFDNVEEMDWYDQVQVNDLKITLLPAVHWSKRTLTDTNRTLWGNFLIEYKNKKIFFSCDTGYGNIYKDLGEKYGPIDLTFINIGAYDFRPMFEKSIYHANPEEALNIGQDLKSKKVLGMHWGTAILSLEDPFEPPVRFKNATNMYGYHKDDAIIFKIGEVQKLEDWL